MPWVASSVVNGAPQWCRGRRPRRHSRRLKIGVALNSTRNGAAVGDRGDTRLPVAIPLQTEVAAMVPRSETAETRFLNPLSGGGAGAAMVPRSETAETPRLNWGDGRV